MSAYVHDGTFTGLVCALAAAVSDPAAEMADETPRQDDLFAPAVEAESDGRKAADFLERLAAVSGPDTVDNIKLCFLSKEKDRDALLLAYARRAFAAGKGLNDRLADPVVNRAQKTALAVLREAHRFKGLVRFRELEDGTLYSEIEPDHNILPLITGHFRRRMAGFNWILHDKRRGLAAMHSGGRLRLVSALEASVPPPSEKEKRTASLWRAFFDSVAIKERLNPGLQRQFVPLKYRKNITEFGED
ncbi:MAG: TIGR03915 family putative DNA repair protein [Elusimicrobiales bacterium]|nr:TIGR03915 family putative DNA repair protein [Elusimicrobiales bacterium]